MEKKIKISASLLSADFLHLEKEIKACEKAGVSSFHLDIMDGHLAPNISYGVPIIRQIRKATKFYLDAHLMIDNPWLYLQDYFDCKVNGILLHTESYDLVKPDIKILKKKPRAAKKINLAQIKKDLMEIKKNKIDAGLTLNPNTELSTILPALKYCDSILIMSVNPGFSGQKFIPAVLKKAEYLRKNFPDLEIKIDGGINQETAPLAIAAGVQTLVTASYLFSAKDYASTVKKLSQPL